MRSDLHKVLHPIAGQADAAASARDASTRWARQRRVVVVGEGREQVEAALAAMACAIVVQSQQRAPPMPSSRPRTRWPASTATC